MVITCDDCDAGWLTSARFVHSQDEMRKELELDPDLPAVLLMGGGEGMGPVEETARALGEELYDDERRRPIGQIVVICGRNRALRSSLQSLTWKVPVKVGNTTQESFHKKNTTQEYAE